MVHSAWDIKAYSVFSQKKKKNSTADVIKLHVMAHFELKRKVFYFTSLNTRIRHVKVLK